MGKLKELEIELDKAYYNPGDILKGRVKVDLYDAMKLRAIRIVFYGESSVHWKTGGRYPTHYRAREEYLNTLIRLWGTGEAQMHAPGLHYYTFQIQLPQNIPSSYEGDRRYLGLLDGTCPIGQINYFCKVIMDVPLFSDYEKTRYFTVVKLTDLNCFPQLMAPGRQEKEESVNCCCARGGISASITINKQAFVIGENIIINAEVENASSSKMTTSVCLKRYALYYGMSTALLGSDDLRPTSSKKVVAQLVHQTFSSGGTDSWVNETLKIPEVDQSIMMECGIIHVFYQLEMHVNVNWGSGPTLVIPVLIGAIPYSDIETARIPDEMTSALIQEFRSLAVQGVDTKHSSSTPSQPSRRAPPGGAVNSPNIRYERLS